jgi:hypothetical protein
MASTVGRVHCTNMNSVSAITNYRVSGSHHVKLFGGNPRDVEVSEAAEQSEIIAKLDTALTSIFTEDGKKTVLFYLSLKYSLTLEQASVDPAKLERALTGLLGEVGWIVVKRAILEHFWERKIPRQEIRVVETASLGEAFGFIKGLGLRAFLTTR